LATEWFGIETVFVIDSLSYLLSAIFIYGAVVPQSTEKAEGPIRFRMAVADVLDGWKHVRTNPRIARIATAKASWAAAGGALVYMLALLGEAVAPEREAAAIGILFAARGLGTGLGPILGRAIFKSRRNWPAVIGGSVALAGACYAVLSGMVWGWLLVVPVIVAHAAGGSNWVFSTVLLQERTIDRYRGRVFATEWLLVMLAETCSILLASLVLEVAVMSLRQAFLIFAVLQIGIGLTWLFWVVPAERDEQQGDSAPG
jgi:hypothetical protein